MAEIKITLDDGTECSGSDLLRMTDLASESGYSRMSLLSWQEGKGRGKNEPLKVWHIFPEPNQIPVVPRQYWEGWLKRTEKDASEAFSRRAARKTSNMGAFDRAVQRAEETKKLTEDAREKLSESARMDRVEELLIQLLQERSAVGKK